MSWPACRAALAAALATVTEIETVLTSPPTGPDGLGGGVFAVVPAAPPARSSERSPGGLTETTYRLSLVVGRRLDSDPDGAALAVDAAVEAVDAAMEGHTSLGGAATSTAPPDWSEAVVEDIPPGTGVEYLTMDGTLEVLVVRSYPDRAAGYPDAL